MEINYLKNMENNGNIEVQEFSEEYHNGEWGTAYWNGRYIKLNSEIGIVCGVFRFFYEGGAAEISIDSNMPSVTVSTNDVNTGKNAAITSIGIETLGDGLKGEWITKFLDENNIYFMGGNNSVNIGGIHKSMYVGSNEVKIFPYTSAGKKYYIVACGSQAAQQYIHIMFIGKPANATSGDGFTVDPTLPD